MTCPTDTLPLCRSTETITIPNLSAGEYDLYLAFVEPVYGNLIQLGLLKKDSVGRHYVGSITVHASH